MAANVRVKVAPGLAGWTAGDHDLQLEAGAEHELKGLSKGALAAVGAAVAAGSLELVSGTVPKVETDKASFAKQATADKAREELYEARDQEVTEAVHADASDEQIEHIFDVWEGRMAEAAQKALEG